MRVLNYHDAFIDLEKLRREGRTEWFIRGAHDGSRGWISHRPKPASLQVRQLPGKRIEISGKISRYKKHLARLGGKLNATSKSYIFPASSLKKLKSDIDLNKVGDLWSGVTEPELKTAYAEYSAGHVWAQQTLTRMPRSQIAKK